MTLKVLATWWTLMFTARTRTSTRTSTLRQMLLHNIDASSSSSAANVGACRGAISAPLAALGRGACPSFGGYLYMVTADGEAAWAASG